MTGEQETVGSVLRACRLLGSFGVDRPVVTLAELTADSGLNKPTVHRLMSTFVAAGWVSRDAAGAYRVRLPLFAIASAALGELDLRDHARGELDGLATGFGNTAFLMVPSEAGAVVIDRVEGGRSLQVAGLSVGTVLPFHAAAAPVVMAAFDDESRAALLARDLPSYTPLTLTDHDLLERRLAEVRDAGWASSHADYLSGVSAVAAPVTSGPSAELVATLSLGGPSDDFEGPALDERVAAVRVAAGRLSDSLASMPR
ncbi:IclR family transcriptional regulator [Solicola sp. PLA-1-18]|uniref:IclR family transcriptional regulator n=1 Tax=Solicola sp. PLA-1-18 TaxID=3380532 RepID=UPI003B7BA2F6